MLLLNLIPENSSNGGANFKRAENFTRTTSRRSFNLFCPASGEGLSAHPIAIFIPLELFRCMSKSHGWCFQSFPMMFQLLGDLKRLLYCVVGLLHQAVVRLRQAFSCC